MNSSESHDLLLEVSGAGGSRDSDKTGRPFLKLWSSTSEIFEIGSRTSSHGEPAKRELDEIREPIRELQKSPNDSLAKSIGEFLFDFLPDTISDFIRKEYQNVNENDGSLRLKIVTKPPGPVDLPWELIRVNGEFLSLRPTVSVVRFTPTSLSAPPLAIQPPVRILFVLSNPNDENMMRGQDEIQAVRGAIDQSKYNYDELWQPTFSQFREKLLSGQYHVVHYIGHGGVGRGDGNLILHDYPEGSYWLGTDQLISILPPTVTLLCLGTGFTSRNYQIQAFNRIGQTWGRYDLPTIVANQMPLSGGSVNSFWNIFYTNLYQTGSVGTAVTKARLHVADYVRIARLGQLCPPFAAAKTTQFSLSFLH